MKYLTLFILFPLLSFSQSPIDADAFFRLAFSATEDFKPDVSGDPVKFPVIEEYEFRTETRDFEFDKQEYTFRVSPSTPEKRKAQQALYNLFSRAPDFQLMEENCERLYTVNEDWLLLYVVNQNIRHLTRLKDVLSDKQVIYEKLAGTLDFDLDKLIKLEIDKSEADLAINDLKQEQEYIKAKYGIENREVNFGLFLTPEDIIKELLLIPESQLTSQDPEAAYEKEIITKELDLEKAETRQFLDFAQLRYRGPHTDFFDERLSIGVGLRIPNSGNRKLRIQELQLEYQEVERDEERKMKNRQERLKDLANQLIKDIRVYQHYVQTIRTERERLSGLGEQLSREQGLSPLFLLDIEDRHISTQLEQLNQEEDILADYLKYLSESGEMCAMDAVNFLRG